jgi:hypothetical protein
LKPGCSKPTISRQLLYIVNDFSLNQVVTEPTRQGNILDLFLTTHPTLVNQSIVTPGISDHDGIPLIDMATKPKKEYQKKRKMYQYKKADMKGLTQELNNLSNKIISQASNNTTSEQLWVSFKTGILKAMDTFIPSKLSSKKHQTPWITPRVRRLLRRKQRAYNKAKKSNLPKDWESFNKQRKDV